MLASGVADTCGFDRYSDFPDQEWIETAEVLTAIAPVSRLELRMCMTIIPILVLLIGLLVFRKHYILTDEKTEEISRTLEERKRA